MNTYRVTSHTLAVATLMPLRCCRSIARNRTRHNPPLILLWILSEKLMRGVKLRFAGSWAKGHEEVIPGAWKSPAGARDWMYGVFSFRRLQWSFENLCFTVVADIVIHGQMPYAGHRPASFNIFKHFWCEVCHFNYAIVLNPVIPFFHLYPPKPKQIA